MRFAPTASAASKIPRYQLETLRSDKSELAFWKRGIVIVQKLLATKRLEALQDSVPNPSSTNGTDNFTLKIKGVPSDVGDVPFPALDHFVSGHEVPDEQEDRHHDVLRHRSDVGSGHFQDLDLMVDGFGCERVTLKLTPEAFVKRCLPAFKSMWSLPTPAVTQSFKFLAWQVIRELEVSILAQATDTYLLNEISSQVSRMEWSSNQDLRLAPG